MRIKNMEKLGGQNVEADLKRMESLLTDMELVQGSNKVVHDTDLERELARLREFGKAHALHIKYTVFFIFFLHHYN